MKVKVNKLPSVYCNRTTRMFNPSSTLALEVAKTAAVAAAPAASAVCAICGFKGHRPHSCRKLASMPVTQRREAVKRASLCFACLKEGHLLCVLASMCVFKNVCSSCSGRHHDLLHEAASSATGHQAPKDPPGESNSQAGYTSTGSFSTPMQQHAEVPMNGEKVSVAFTAERPRSC